MPTVELRFRGKPPIHLDDEFTIGREQLVKLIQEHAAPSGATVALTTDDPVAEARFGRMGLIAIGLLMLSILLVAILVVGLAWHARRTGISPSND